jgi:phosphohistidine phosphatase
MGAYAAARNLRVDRIVSSTALRAWSTAQLFRSAFDPQMPLTSRRELYHADPETLLAVAREEAGNDKDARIMLVGHNPGLHELALFLCREGASDLIARVREKFPTGALAEFDAPGWPSTDASPSGGHLLRFVRPRDLPIAGREKL